MSEQLLNSDDSLLRQNKKLRRICNVLMNRLENDTDHDGRDFAQFEHAAILEEQVRLHTAELQTTLEKLNRTNLDLDTAKRKAEKAERDLYEAIEAFSLGFGLFDIRGVLVMKNSRFCQSFPDVKDRIFPGMTVYEFVHLISQSCYLDTSHAGGREAWERDRIQRYAQPHLAFTLRLIGDRWTKVSQHQTPSQGTVILQTDVTDIMRLQAGERDKLIDGQARLIRATLEHLGQGICIFDPKARLVSWNRMLIKILQIDEGDFSLGRDFEALYFQVRPKFEPVDSGWARVIREWVLQKHKRSPLKFAVKTKLQQFFSIYAHEMPDGGFLISFADITAERNATENMARTNESLERRVTERTMELNNALEAARRANASKSRFVAAASHDVLQPLSAAKLFLSSIDKVAMPAQTGVVIGKTQDALNSVEDILSALLEISKLESDQDALDVGSIELGPIFRRMADEFAPSAAAQGLDFSLVACEESVVSDASFLQRILRNLISNAIRYTDSGKILVGARRDGANLRLEVHDTGRGIPEDEQKNIFREFYRTDTAASAAQGMGLGLAIVERACQRLGHPMGMVSEMGKGTKFYFTVPVSQGVPSAAPTKTGAGGTPARAAGLVVLLVENDYSLRRAITTFLKKWNVGVLAVGSGDEAKALLDDLQFVPDAFLVDFQLNEKDNGIDLITALQKRYGKIPASIVSANRTPELRQNCAAAGLDLIHKPIDPAVFRAFLESVRKAQSQT